MPTISATQPWNRLTKPPPQIIMIRKLEPSLVFLPRPAIARVKMHGHITLQNRPTEVKAKVEGSELAPGQYGFGFVGDKFVITDVGANDVLSVSSNALFQATFATLSRRDDTTHLCSATNDCELVRVSVVQ